MDPSARLLRLLSLLQSNRDWTGGELAQELDVSGRTVRKDIDRVRNLGYAVDATRGAVGGYRLGIGAAMPPLLLDDDESVAIVIGLLSAARSGISGQEAAAQRALVKMEQMLPIRLRNRVAALRTMAVQIPDDEQLPTVDSAMLSTIATARRNLERLRIAYTRHDGVSSRRIVDPHNLVNWGQRWYLVAWDAERNDWRTFRVDRIARVEATGLLFDPRPTPEEDMSRYIALNVSRAGWVHTATFVIAASADQVLAQINPAVGTVEAIDESTCVLRTGADNLSSIAVYIGLLGFEFRIVDGAELHPVLRETAMRYLRALGEG